MAEFENDKETDHCLKIFLRWQKNPALKDSSKYLSPDIHVLASSMKSFISGKSLFFKANLSFTTHGLTRCLELVDIFKKIEIGISYNNATNFYATWAKQVVESDSLKLLMIYPEQQ